MNAFMVTIKYSGSDNANNQLVIQPEAEISIACKRIEEKLKDRMAFGSGAYVADIQIMDVGIMLFPETEKK